jgi:tetratricopeptide (TPR) repeat protein
LLSLPPDDLARVDIALMNLLCAEGLPGSEDLDIPATLATLDEWTNQIQLETLRYYPRFLQNPAENNHSEADFRMLTLITVLQLDLGVHYNLEKANDPDFSNSKDQFIHGLVNSDNGGTCVSMPALYTAIARRLGHPVRLVEAKAHLFARWDDPEGERLNIDGAGQGMNALPDSFYRGWPKPISDEEVASGHYLKSLSPEEELGVFLAARGHCLRDNGMFAEALEAYREAAQRHPTPDYRLYVDEMEGAIAGRLILLQLDGTPILPRKGASGTDAGSPDTVVKPRSMQ